MMPIAFNLTLMNSNSMISKIDTFSVKLEKIQRLRSQLLGADQGKLEVRDCVNLDFVSDDTIWPFFSNVKVKLTTIDSIKCRNLEETDLQFKVKLDIRDIGIS